MWAGRAQRVAVVLTVAGCLFPVDAHGSSRVSGDKGFCAVRVILDSADAGRWLYVARNKCDSPVLVKLVAQGHGIYCQAVAPYGYVAWSTIYFDHHWAVEQCNKAG